MNRVGYQDRSDKSQRYSKKKAKKEKTTNAKSDCKRSSVMGCSTKPGIVENISNKIDGDTNSNSQISGQESESAL